MPPVNDTSRERRSALRDLLKAGPQPNQKRLVDLLERRGFVATQSSVSRDLRDMGAVKTARGYELSDRGAGDDEIASVATLLRTLTPAGPNLLVLRTAIGAAQRVALALDRSGWNEIVGTVAGDDTVFVATAGAVDQRRVLARMHSAGAAA